MSTRWESYVMVAVDLTDEPMFLKKYEKELEDLDIGRDAREQGSKWKDTTRLVSLSDGMNGEYHFLGRILAVGDPEDNGDGFPKPLTFDPAYIEDHMRELQGELSHTYGIEELPLLRVFTHWH